MVDFTLRRASLTFLTRSTYVCLGCFGHAAACVKSLSLFIHIHPYIKQQDGKAELASFRGCGPLDADRRGVLAMLQCLEESLLVDPAREHTTAVNNPSGEPDNLRWTEIQYADPALQSAPLPSPFPLFPSPLTHPIQSQRHHTLFTSSPKKLPYTRRNHTLYRLNKHYSTSLYRTYTRRSFYLHSPAHYDELSLKQPYHDLQDVHPTCFQRAPGWRSFCE